MSEKEAGGGKGGKKEEVESVTVVFKIDMHCEGCVKKINKSVKKFQGVESVQGDMANNKLTVKGKVDPAKLREKIQEKTKKKVDLISPQPKKEGAGGGAGGGGGGGGDKKKSNDEKKGGGGGGDDKKNKEIPVTAVVLKIRLHCDGCIQRIHKIISKYKGVNNVEIDTQKDLVTVRGTMDIKSLQPYLKEKLKRPVDIIPPKKEGGDKKADADGGEKKADAGGGGGAGGGDKKAKPAADGDKKMEGNKMDHVYGNDVYGGYSYGNGYAVEYVHAPQIFSDENPNACSVM